MWLCRGSARKQNLELWAGHGSYNFEHRIQLLAAEEYFCTGNVQSAQESYKNAIKAASEHRFVSDLALAHELAASFYMCIGDMSKSLEHLKSSYEKYHEWGAVKKAQELDAFASATFGSALGDSNR